MASKKTLETLRAQKALSRHELARLAECAPSTIWRIEKARHVPIMQTRRRLSLALGLDTRAILWPEGAQVYAQALV
jgi:DNA-binding XRE family transcriptional regulator